MAPAPPPPTTTTTTTRTTTRTTLLRTKSRTATMLCNALIASIIASFVLSAEAILCHQCNSHLDEDCFGLRLSTPSDKLDEQYLKECETRPGIEPFCRKTVVTIEATAENRVIRGCGWIGGGPKNNICYNADDEGFLQTICACDTDGCNAAPSLLTNGNVFVVLSLLGAVLMLSSQYRFSL